MNPLSLSSWTACALADAKRYSFLSFGRPHFNGVFLRILTRMGHNASGDLEHLLKTHVA